MSLTRTAEEEILIFTEKQYRSYYAVFFHIPTISVLLCTCRFFGTKIANAYSFRSIRKIVKSYY